METPNVPTSAPAANAPKVDAPVTGDKNVPANGKPAATPAGNQPTAAEIRKLKIRDQEYAEDEAAQLIEKGRGADKKFQEAAAARKEVEKVLYQLKTNPGKVLLNKALGHNPAAVIRELVKEAAEAGMDLTDLKKTLSEVMYEWIQEENLDPRERENRQLKKELERRDAEKRAAQEEQERQQLERETAEAYKALDEDITGTLKTSGLPKSTFTVKRMAYYLDQAFKLKAEFEARGQKVRAPKAADVVKYVRRDYENMFRDLYQNADVDTLIKLVGEENVSRIRQYDVERFKKGGQPTPPAPKKTDGDKKQVERPKSSKDFLRQREAEIRAKEREERGY